MQHTDCATLPEPNMIRTQVFVFLWSLCFVFILFVFFCILKFVFCVYFDLPTARHCHSQTWWEHRCRATLPQTPCQPPSRSYSFSRETKRNWQNCWTRIICKTKTPVFLLSGKERGTQGVLQTKTQLWNYIELSNFWLEWKVPELSTI